MRKSRFVIVACAGLALTLACTTKPPPPPPGPPAFDCKADPFGEAFGPTIIRTLAQPDWNGRKYGSEGLKRATEWVANQFECIGLVPGAPALPGLAASAYRIPFETDGDKLEDPSTVLGYAYDPAARYTFTNVVGSLAGSGALANEVIVVGAHLDHLGASGEFDGQVVLGADDDASGVAAVLAIARDLANQPATGDRRTIVFAAWGVEEDPFYKRGSEAFLGALQPDALARVMYYVNFDMVGGYAYRGAVEALGAYSAGDGHAASAAYTLLDGIVGGYADLHVSRTDPAGNNSDHHSFCRRGIPYVFFWTDDDCYHKPCDVPARIDTVHLRRILQLGADLTRALASEPSLAPTRKDFVAAHVARFGVDCSVAASD
ncbi:MAG: M20/M25/M40 family metallo-hydrolase [Polyangiaceae bacterium]